MLFKYYRSYSTFRNIFNTLVIVILVCTILFAFFLYTVFSKLTIDQANNISTSMLSRLVFMTEQLYNDTYSILLTLGYGENTDLNTMMFAKERDRLRDYSGYTRMRLLQSIYPGITYIGVYNGQLDEMMCTVGLEPDTEDRIRQEILDGFGSQKERLLIPMNNQIVVPIERDPSVNTLTIVYYSPLSRSGRIGAIFLAIDCEYLSQYITTINKDDFQMTMLLDSQGRVLSHPDSAQILSDYSGYEYVSRTMASDATSGDFMADIAGEDTLVTYMKGQLFDWTYITLTPYADILHEMNFVRIITLATSLLVVLLGILFSLFATRHTFSPIASLLTKAGYTPDPTHSRKEDEIKYLDERFTYYLKASSANDALLMDYALESLLTGELSEEKAALLRENESHLTAPYYLVCLLSINRSDAYRDMARKEKNYLRYSLAKIAGEFLAPLSMGTHAVNVASNRVALIVRLSSATVPKGMVLALMETQKVFSQHFPLEFSVSVSSLCDDLIALQDAYEEAAQLLTEGFFVGKSSIIMKRERKVSPAVYNQRLENEIWSAIRDNDEEEIGRTLALFMDELRTQSYEHARLYIGQLTINLLNQCLNLQPDAELERFSAYKSILEYADTLDKAHAELLALCRQMATYHSGEDDNDSHEAIDQALALAKERYADMSFSTNAVAQEVGLSIIYFNRVFRKKMGQSYSTYLNNYRLNMACTLLCSTTLSMKSICNEVGMSNESYFYTLFKKEYGITPYQYRKKYSNG